MYEIFYLKCEIRSFLNKITDQYKKRLYSVSKENNHFCRPIFVGVAHFPPTTKAVAGQYHPSHFANCKKSHNVFGKRRLSRWMDIGTAASVSRMCESDYLFSFGTDHRYNVILIRKICLVSVKTIKTYLWCFPVIWLCLPKPSCVAPVTRITLSGWSNFRTRTRPKPTVYISRYQIGTVTSVKVTFSSRRPNVSYISFKILFNLNIIKNLKYLMILRFTSRYSLLYELVLLWSF